MCYAFGGFPLVPARALIKSLAESGANNARAALTRVRVAMRANKRHYANTFRAASNWRANAMRASSESPRTRLLAMASTSESSQRLVLAV